MITTQRVDGDPVLHHARQTLLRFAALSLLDPRTGSWQELVKLRDGELLPAAAALVRGDPSFQADELGPAERPIIDLDPVEVLAALPDSQAELNRQFEAVFGLLLSCACPPYEMEYINDKFTFQRSQTLADIAGYYHAFGLRPSSQHPERQDHLVLALEFVAFLIGHEEQARELHTRDRDVHATVCRDAQERFLTDHLLWWAPAFAKLLQREACDRFYSEVARFLAALLTAERSRLGLPAPHGHVRPSSIDVPEACEGCQFSG
jgi:TorA maturation chaperone TorD